MSGRKRSRIWTFFDEVEDDKLKVKCTLCNSLLSRGGTGRQASTSALTNHFKLIHKEEYDKVQQESQKDQPSTSRAQNVQQNETPKKQQTLEDTFMKKWSIDDCRSQEIHYAIAEMIASDNQPISILEDTGFNRLMNLLRPKYQLPGRKYMSEGILQQLYEKVKNIIKAEIVKAKAITITTDMWTCMNNLNSFLSFTAHWLDEEFSLHHNVLQMIHFTGPHTANNIRIRLEEMANKWQIDSQVHLIVRDNGPNIVKAINDSPYVGKGCFIHTLQLAIKNSLQVQENVSEVLSLAKRIVTHFNHSSQAQEKLFQIQSELNLAKHKLVQDVSTRWNSTYYMCERLLEQKRAVSLYISDNCGTINLQNLTERQWQVLKETMILLQPFEEITKSTSSTFSSISEVIPHVTVLIKYLQKPEVEQICPTITAMRQTLQTELSHRFKGIKDDKYYTLATLLDPRFRLKFFSPEKYENIKAALFREQVKRSDESESSSSDNEDTRPRLQNITNLMEPHAIISSCYEEIATTSQASVSEENPKSPIAIEVEKYLNEHLLKRNLSPFEWWAKNKQKYELLGNLAKIFLSSPATSVYSERLFSEAGNVYEEKRNRLLPDRAEHLVFLHHNLPLINFKY